MARARNHDVKIADAVQRDDLLMHVGQAIGEFHLDVEHGLAPVLVFLDPAHDAEPGDPFADEPV